MFLNRSISELQELLLHSARNGEISELDNLLKAQAEGSVEFNVSCKGRLILIKTKTSI